MYIIEKFIQIFKKFSNKEIDSLSSSESIGEDISACRHTFMPIDSTGQILACSKCGYLIRKDEL